MRTTPEDASPFEELLDEEHEDGANETVPHEWIESLDTLANGRKVLPLRNSVRHGEELIDTLHFRQVRAGDLRKIKAKRTDEIAYCLELAHFLCGKPQSIVDSLEGPDIARVMQITSYFLLQCLGTGLTD